MKMKKRLFQSKNKKKKLTSSTGEPVINDAGITHELPSSEENHAKITGAKKKLRFRKNKSKNHKTVDHDPCQHTAPNGSNVVLRRTNKHSNSPFSDYSRGNKSVIDRRIPDSVSSSRTASSASTSSSSRWSSRRPWSLAESLQPQSLSEFEEPGDDDERTNANARPVSGLATVQRNESIEELDSSQQSDGQSKGFPLDIHFFRRLKRSSYTPKTTPQEKNPSPQPFQSLSSERLSLRLSSFKSNKNSKNNRRSWHEPSHNYSLPSDSEFSLTSSSSSNLHTAARRSVTDPSGFLGIKESIAEEQSQKKSSPTNRNIPVRPSSFSSANTTFVALDYVSKRSSVRDKIVKQDSTCSNVFSTNSQNKERCENCRNRKDNDSRRSVCYCYFVPPGVLRVDDDQATLARNPSSITDSPDDFDDSDYPTSPLHFAVPARPYSVGGSDCSKWKKDSMHIGGSLMNLNTGSTATKWADDDESTLTRQNIRTRNAGFRLEASKGSAVYASSPQLCEESVSDKRWWKKSRKMPTTAGSSGSVGSILSRESAVVDSPIKRAIGFPGVVLRRHRHFKHANESQLAKTASDDLLSKEERAKQVTSLNMEDLPTYTMMRDTSLNDKENRSSGGRELSRAAILYQRILSHATSVDDLSKVVLGNGDFLDNLYAADIQANTSSVHEEDRSNQNQEPSTKRVKTLRKSVVSFANLISPGKPGRGKLQRSSSFKESDAPAYKPYRPPGSSGSERSNTSSNSGSNYTPGKRSGGSSAKKRQSKLWCETFDHTGLEEQELKRQEAIFELYQGECVMVQDLKMAKQTYRDSMMTLKMLSEEEVTRIFGTLDCLLPLHEDLLSRLEATRSENGRTEGVGHVFIEWFPTLSPYNEYCANQADAKETLDSVINRPRVHDFLQRCLESPFSRKLDLWSYLDLPRSRLVKYPLLLKAIQKATPPEHPDSALLENALSAINEIIARVDHLTGERQCKFVQSKLEYIDEKKRCREVDESRKIICSGQLKTSRGTKVQVFLFDLALVVSRNATRGEKLTYQVSRPPLPLKSVSIETDEGGKLSGSFKGGILISDKTIKHAFRVKSEQLNIGYTLAAADEHDKKQWINSIQEAMSKCQLALPQELPARSSPRVEKEKKKSFVKRSSSSKSDSSTDSQENYRSGRRSSEDKRVKSPLKIRKNSTPRRNSDQSLTESSKRNDVADELKNLNESSPLEKAFRRTKSLTGSPITRLASSPGRRRSSAVEAPVIENGVSKPPLGKVLVSPHRYNLRSFSKTPPKSPRLSSTRSTPDLLLNSYLRRRSLESERLLSIHDQMTIAPPASRDSPLPPRQISAMPHVMVDSPDHPAASNTSQNFPIVEEESISPAFKSLSSIQVSSSSPSVSISFPSVYPIKAWGAPVVRRSSKDDPECSSRSSSESLSDIPPVIDDAEVILENVEDQHENSADITFSHGAMTSDAVMLTVNNLVDRVCESLKHDNLQLTSQENYVTITSEDGTPWRGDNIEMSV